MPKLPDYMPAGNEPTPAKPYRLVAAPSRQFLNSTFTEMPTSLRREHRPTARSATPRTTAKAPRRAKPAPQPRGDQSRSMRPDHGAPAARRETTLNRPGTQGARAERRARRQTGRNHPEDGG